MKFLIIFNLMIIFSLSLTNDEVRICFPKNGVYKNYYPTNLDDDTVYSVSNKQRISRPIIAYLCTKNNRSISHNHQLFSTLSNPVFFNVTSLPAWDTSQQNSTIEAESNCKADPITTDPATITLCQKAANEFDLNDPRRFVDAYCRKQCSHEVGVSIGAVISNIRIHGVYLIVQGLYHIVDTSDSDTQQYCLLRKLRFDVFKPKTNVGNISTVTNPFKVYTRIPRLSWIKPPDHEISANHNFNLSLEIIDQSGNRIRNGLDSTLIVEIAVGFQFKTFMREPLVEDFLYDARAELAGDNVITSLQNYDRVLHKRALEGLVVFNNVAIRDVYYQRSLAINATLLVPRTGDRQPLNYSDFNPLCFEFLKLEHKKEFLCSDYTDLWARGSCKFDDDHVNGVDSSYEFYTVSMKSSQFNSRVCTETLLFGGLKVKEQEAATIHIIGLNAPDVVISDVSQYDDLLELNNDFHITSHFQIPGVWVVVLDKDGYRIYSGPDSSLIIQVQPDPSHIKMCKKDTNFTTHRGLGSFRGAVQQTTPYVRFNFSTKNSNGHLLYAISQNYVVTGEVNIAVFGRFNTAGLDGDPDPVFQSFARFAAEDVNENASVLGNKFPFFTESNLTIKLKIFDTEQSYAKTAELFMDMMKKEEQSNFKESICGIIGFGDDEVTHKMNALLETYNMPIIIYREEYKEFTRKDSHKSMISIGWNLIIRSIHSGHYLHLRWNYIIVIEDAVKPILFDYRFGVSTTYKYVVIHQMFIDKQTDLKDDIERAKKTGSRTVITFVDTPRQYFLYREAIRYNFTPMHGYQWALSGIAGKQFDFENKSPECREKPTCTEAFEGMVMLCSVQNVSGFSTPLWYHVNRKFFEMDVCTYRGVPTRQPYFVFGEMALGYDAVLTYAHSLERLLRSGEIVNKSSIVQAIHGLKFEGLTGCVRYSREGRYRLGSTYALLHVSAKPIPYDFDSIQYSRWLVISDYHMLNLSDILNRKKRHNLAYSQLNVGESSFGEKFTRFQQVIEIPVECESLSKRNLQYFPTFVPRNESRLIAHFYLSTRGYFSVDGQLISNRWTKNVDEICIRTEFIVPSYYCDQHCGGKRLYSDSAIEFGHGVCEFPNECRCRLLSEINSTEDPDKGSKFAYSGDYCRNIVCNKCIHGSCQNPFNCSCNPGWTGEECNVTECPVQCVNGKCINPNSCSCDIGYYGTNCEVLVGFMIAIIFVCAGVVLVFFILFARWWNKKRKIRIELIAFDWLVDWKDVIEKAIPQSKITTPTSTVVEVGISPASRSDSQQSPFRSVRRGSRSPGTFILAQSDLTETTYSTFIENTAEWKGQDVFYVKYDIDSLDINSDAVRKEIMQLIELKHPNLIRLLGICLTAPNVAILLEIVPKGSLSEIVESDAYQLSWNFKFSILKDIASGMEYIHQSKLGSHGHLTSKNCLIDNRWTCKISGFGIPNVRQVNYSKRPLEDVHRAMLWTAPELLRMCATMNDVGTGTESGDVYSYGIIVTEMCTHDPPFYYELQLLSPEELLRLLRNFYDSGTMGLKKLLDTFNYDTSKPIRPALLNARMPDIYSEKKGIQNLIAITLAEEPFVRINFTEILNRLDAIHPLKGLFIENLIYMLEKYTNHLEEIFLDKVKEVQLEKNKTEELIGRLLPLSVAEEMKLNHEILPELFDEVTFFYSDIVGFTAIAKNSKPMEVVEMLNDLYTCFDSVIEMFDVYKLETIGDAYCVASGVPNPAEDHCEQIATMSLFILAAVNSFPIRHMPMKKLSVRIGIHSGSCVAGVVGIKMPRYCIFGEDVTIAQFMESRGEPDGIQISEATAKLLAPFDVYVFEFAGHVDIPFLGKFQTYWLIGKEGLDFTQPIKKQQFSKPPSQVTERSKTSAISSESVPDVHSLLSISSRKESLRSKSFILQPAKNKTQESVIRLENETERTQSSIESKSEEQIDTELESFSEPQSSIESKSEEQIDTELESFSEPGLNSASLSDKSVPSSVTSFKSK